MLARAAAGVAGGMAAWVAGAQVFQSCILFLPLPYFYPAAHLAPTGQALWVLRDDVWRRQKAEKRSQETAPKINLE